MSNPLPTPDFSHQGVYSNSATGINPVAVRTRPSGVSATGVLSIIAGLMGLMASFGTAMTLVFNDAMLNMSAGQTKGMSSEQVKAIEEMTVSSREIASRYSYFTIGIGVFTFIVSIALLVGGIGLLRNRSSARRLLSRTFVAAIILELLAGVVYVMTQLEMAPVMAKYMTGLTGGGNQPMAPGGAQMMGQAMIYFGLAFSLLWAIIKIVLYAVGKRYLNRPAVVDYFETSAAPKTT